MVNYLGVCSAIRNFCRDSGIEPSFIIRNGMKSCEFGGELPAVLAASLKAGGASVDLYRHHGTVATIVSVP